MIYALSKLFTALLLPPGLFILILALCAVFAKRFRRPLAGAALLLYLMSIHPVADRVLALYEEPYRNLKLPETADAVVSLGGGNIRGNPIPLVDEAFKRHIYGLAIAKRMDIPLIVSGSGERGYNEYLALADSLKRLDPILRSDLNETGSPSGFRIIPETRSQDTYENAKLSAELLEKREPALIVVTSAYHMRRALALFRLAGIKELYPAAVNFYTDRTKRGFEAKDLLPSIWALLNSYRAMHEFFGMVKVKVREIAKG
ncbi:putative membrane protein [Hydrogenimonas sp.]|nr:putative membrane protein [Hydrogenimonas sp.]